MSDSESVLSRAVQAALKVGVGKPARWLFGGPAAAELERRDAREAEQENREAGLG